MRPDRVVVGVEDVRSEEVLRRLYRPLDLREKPLVVTSLEEAEIINAGHLFGAAAWLLQPCADAAGELAERHIVERPAAPAHRDGILGGSRSAAPLFFFEIGKLGSMALQDALALSAPRFRGVELLNGTIPPPPPCDETLLVH
jgi:hypothetical protein